MRRPILMLAFMTAAAIGLLARPEPTLAECPFFVVPPATDAARSAREVVVGTVIENVDGNVFDFKLRVDHVLRGPAHVGDVIRMDEVYPRWPLAKGGDGTTIGPCAPIPGSEGNVIALAFDALAPDGRTRYTAASWILGKVPFYRELSRTTLDEMAAIVRLPATDVGRSTSIATDVTDVSGPVLLVVFVSVLVAMTRHRPHSHPDRT